MKKYKVLYGKVNKSGTGNVDSLLGEFDTLKEVENAIKTKKSEILRGWSGIQKGDRVEIWVDKVVEYDPFNDEAEADDLGPIKVYTYNL